MRETTIDLLQVRLFLAKRAGTVTDHTHGFQLPIDAATIHRATEARIAPALIELYRSYDGFQIAWKGPETAGGSVQFHRMNWVLKDQLGTLYEEDDVSQEDLLPYYRPFVSLDETLTCGLLVTPDFAAASVYVHDAPEPELRRLDLDVDGFLTMAHAAAVHHHWVRVLLDLRSGRFDTPEVESLRAGMAAGFPDFEWDAFVRLYATNRLPAD